MNKTSVHCTCCIDE